MKPITVLIRGLLALALVVAGLLLGLVAALWFFPGETFRWGASFAKRAGVVVSLPQVGGNPAAGWRFDNLSAEGPGFSVTARRLYVDVDWASLAAGRPALDALWTDGLSVLVRPTAAPAAPKKQATGPMTLPAIHDVRLTDGRFALERPGQPPVDVTRLSVEGDVFPTGVEIRRADARFNGNDIAAKGRYDVVAKSGVVEVGVADCLRWPGASLLEAHCVRRVVLKATMNGNDVALDALSAEVAGSTVTAAGAFKLAPFSGKLAVASRGPLVVHADAAGDARGWKGQGEARAGANALAFSGAVRFGAVPSYDFDVKAAGVPADLVPGLPPPLGKLSGEIAGALSGATRGRMSGHATIHLAASQGPSVAGDVTLNDGDATARLTMTGGGLDGGAAARWNLVQNQGAADVKLKIDGKTLVRWAPAAADGTVSASVNGRWPLMRWRAGADLKKVAASGVSIERVIFHGAGDRLSPPAGRATIEITNLAKGEQKIDSAKATVSGTAARHTVDITLVSEGRTVSGHAAGALADGRWTSTWDKFDLKIGDAWALSRPFELSAGAGGARVRNLRMTAGAARLAADGAVADGRLENVRVRADGVAVGPLAEALKSPIKLAGTAELNATASGPVDAPEGRTTLTIENLAVNGTAAGTLLVETRVAGGRLHADTVRLTGPAGRLDASGSVPLSFNGASVPPFDLRVRTDGLDPSALPLPPGMKFEKARLNGDLTVNAAHGRFAATGQLAFVADRFQLEAQGLDLREIDLRLTADGRELRVARATAKTAKGTVTIDGAVSSADVGLSLRARDFQMDHPAGILLRTDADLSLSGKWDAPRLTGTVDVGKLDINPGRQKKKYKKEQAKKKKEEAAAPPAPRRPPAGSPLSADVRIVFPDNVWYKDGQSSIEFKGDLDVRKESGGEPRIFGTVSTVRGEYIFYGRSFTFEQGQVIFVGEEPIDPSLNILATYVTQQNNVKIHLTAKGTVSKPEVTLTSEPPMEETDIVSVLVNGNPRGSGGGSEEEARLMAANYLAEKVRSHLQNRFGIDQLKLNLTPGGAAEVTVGQNVTKDLYVSYARTLGAEGERKLNAEYTLTPIWSLNGDTSSLGRYVIDLLFKFGFH